MTGLATGNGFPNVVVTGVAMTTALATDAEGTWKKLLEGQSGIRLLDDSFVEEYDLPVRIGGHLLEDFDGELTRVELRRLSYLQKMSTIMSRRVWKNAGDPEVGPGDGVHRAAGRRPEVVSQGVAPGRRLECEKQVCAGRCLCRREVDKRARCPGGAA